MIMRSITTAETMRVIWFTGSELLDHATRSIDHEPANHQRAVCVCTRHINSQRHVCALFF